jgi:hypothetical protein
MYIVAFHFFVLKAFYQQRSKLLHYNLQILLNFSRFCLFSNVIIVCDVIGESYFGLDVVHYSTYFYFSWFKGLRLGFRVLSLRLQILF